MPIEIELPGGAIIEFPSGTDAATIQQVISGNQAQTFEPAQPKMGAIEAAGRGALQGISFGLSDEAYGAIKGAGKAIQGGSFNDAYNENVELARAANRRAAQDNPLYYYGGEIGSAALIPGGAFGAAAKGASLAARTKAGAKAGLMFGGLYGFGKGEGGLENRAVSAATGAATGAAFGAALPAAGDVVSAAAQRVARPIKAMANPKAVAREKFGEALMRDRAVTQTTGNEIGRLQRQLAEANRLSGDADPAFIADMGAENTRNLLRTAANMPSRSAEVLRKKLDLRQSYAPNRIERSLSRSMMGGNNKRYYETVDDLIAGARDTSKPYYDQAFSQKSVTPSAGFSEVLNRPWMKRVKELAEESMQNEGVDPSSLRPVEMYHRIKLALDHAIGQSKRGIQDSKSAWDTRTLVRLKKDFLRELEGAVPAYKEARVRYSGPAALRSAADDGFELALKEAPELLQRRLQSMGMDERNAFRIGAMQSLRDKMMTGHRLRDRVRSMFGSPDIQKRLEILMPSSAARRDFQKSLIMEAKMAATRQAVQGGSSTARQLAQAEEAGQPLRAAQAAAGAFSGKLEPLVTSISRGLQRFSGITPHVADEIIKTAMSSSGKEGLMALERAMKAAERSPQARDIFLRRFAQGAIAAQDQ